MHRDSSHFFTLSFHPSHKPGPLSEFHDVKILLDPQWYKGLVLSGLEEHLIPSPSATPREQAAHLGTASLSSTCSHGLSSGVLSSGVTWALTSTTPHPTPEPAAPGDREPGVHVRDAGEGVRGDGEAARGHAGADSLQ